MKDLIICQVEVDKSKLPAVASLRSCSILSVGASSEQRDDKSTSETASAVNR